MSKLKISKLENFLISHNFIIKRFFTRKNICIYIQILNILNGDTFLLYIPSKYKIYADDKESNIKIDYIDYDFDKMGNIDISAKNLNVDSDYVENSYPEIDINLDIDTANFQKTLENKYIHDIDISRKNNMNILQTYRQLNRLKLCVQNIVYKICIINNNIMYCITRNNDIQLYQIKNIDIAIDKTVHTNDFMVSIDLDEFYKNIKRIDVDIKTVKLSIMKILDKNQDRHIKNMRNMVEKTKYIYTLSDKIHTKKIKIKEYIYSLEKLLDELNVGENEIVRSLGTLKNNHREINIKGMYDDINNSLIISRYENKLSQLKELRQNIIEMLDNVTNQYHNLSLIVDNILFDSSVMIDTLIKHSNILENIY